MDSPLIIQSCSVKFCKKPQFTVSYPETLNVFLLTEKYKVKRLISGTDYNSLCYCGGASPLSHSLSLSLSLCLSFSLSQLCYCVSAHLHTCTHTHTHKTLSLFLSVYKLQQSHPSKPVDHEIRLRRTAVNDTGVDTNENIQMKKYRSKTADTVVVIGIQNYISQLPLLDFI